MGFISRSLSLKIRPLAGTSRTGTKNWYCPRTIRRLGRPGIHPGLYTNRYPGFCKGGGGGGGKILLVVCNGGVNKI